MSSTVLLLVSSISSGALDEVHTRRVTDIIIGTKVVYETIDGADAQNVELRNKLFGISNLRGKYPQVFIKTGDEYVFVGNKETVEELLEANSLPAEVLEANPGIQTLEKVFATVAKKS